MKILALNDSIVIEWCDQAESKLFERSGIVLQRKLDANRGNWAKVIAVGPKVQNIKEGNYVLPLKTWKQDSEFVNQVEGGMISLTGDPKEPLKTYYKTLEEWCAFVSDDVSVTYELNGENTLQVQEDFYASDLLLKQKRRILL